MFDVSFSIDDVFMKLIKILGALHLMLLYKNLSQCLNNTFSHCGLLIPEFFINLMLQHHLEKMNFVINLMIVSNCTNNSLCLLNNNTLESILLIKIGIQILLHRLTSLFVLIDTFVIVLNLL